MRQVADQVFRLGSRSHNFYLMVDSGEATIIDAGCRGEWRSLIAALEANSIDIGQVSGMLITHVHADHFGLAKRAVDQAIEVAVHIEDEPRALGTYEGRFSAEISDLPYFNPRVLWTFLPLVRVGVTSLDRLNRVNTFVDRERLDLPGRPIAIHTPGHTEGHAMFHCPESGVLFTGDGLTTMSLLGKRRGPQLIDDVFSVDPIMAGRSLDNIVDLEAELLLPGHGEPWVGRPADAVALARL